MPTQRVAPALLMLLATACGGERIFGGGELHLTLSDPLSGLELSWDLEGINDRQLARAGGEVIPPLYHQGRGGGLVHYQLGSTFWVVGIARAAVRAEADQAFMRVNGPVEPGCVEELQTVYFEYRADLTAWNEPRERTGWMNLKVMDEDVERPHYTSESHLRTVFWEARHPEIDDMGAFSDEFGFQPAASAHTSLQLESTHAGSLQASGVPWRGPEAGCWSSFQPEIALEWAMDPRMEKRVRY